MMRELLAEDQGPKDLLAQLDTNEQMISLQRLNLLVDLYHYYPVLRTKDRNISTELYYILSSNKKGQAFEGNTLNDS